MRTPRLRWLKWIAIGILIVAAALTLLLATVVFTTLTPPPPAASRSTISVLVAVATAIIAAELLALQWGIWWLWWRLPQRQVARLAISISDPKARADAENNFRRTVGQALGGAAVLIGVGVAYLQLMRQQDATHDLLISDQVSKGFEQLAADKLPMRLGGIYALEGVMNGSQKYYQPVLEALCAFVRDTTMGRDRAVSPKPATDIQAALTVIGRRAQGSGQVDLDGAIIPNAQLSFAHLQEANLYGTDLSGAELTGAHLEDADLQGAHLQRARLAAANLELARLSGADLSEGVRLVDADLTWVDLTNANMDGISLSRSRLDHAELQGANLHFADLTGSVLTGADLSGADLRDAVHLTQAQLDQACGTDAQLPPRLTLKPCPPPPALPAR